MNDDIINPIHPDMIYVAIADVKAFEMFNPIFLAYLPDEIFFKEGSGL